MNLFFRFQIKKELSLLVRHMLNKDFNQEIVLTKLEKKIVYKESPILTKSL